MNKQDIVKIYLEHLDKKIEKNEKALDSLYEGVYSAPGPSQSHSDTTRFQQSNIASDTDIRLTSLKKVRTIIATMLLRKSQSVEIGALIVIEDSVHKEREYYFVVPDGGGESIEFEGVEILFVSIQVPMVEATSRVKIGDSFEFRGRKLILIEIL